MYRSEPLLYEQGFSVTVNKASDPLFYFFDYDTRSHNINMEFQHFHEFYELFILLEDKEAEHIIEGDCYKLQQYDIVLLKPMLLHKSVYPAGPPCRRLVINFSIPSGIPSLEGDLARALDVFSMEPPVFRFSGQVQEILFALLNDIFRIERERPPTRDLLVHAKFLEFLCLLKNRQDDNVYKPEKTDDSITQKIYSVASYIHSNYHRELSLESLAGQIFISPYYLSHQFKSVVGFSLVNYIQMTRIRNAQQYLLYTDLKISEITERCGFNSFSQFNRVFRKFCNVSPSQYRAVKGVGVTAFHFGEATT